MNLRRILLPAVCAILVAGSAKPAKCEQLEINQHQPNAVLLTTIDASVAGNVVAQITQGDERLRVLGSYESYPEDGCGEIVWKREVFPDGRSEAVSAVTMVCGKHILPEEKPFYIELNK